MERSSIQLLHKRSKSQRQIARELGRSRATVARALREPVDRAPAARDRPSIVDSDREDIGRRLAEGLTAARMLELARSSAPAVRR
jgi:IS30 family transposase